MRGGKVSQKAAIFLIAAAFCALFVSVLLGLILLGFAIYYWDR